jgi:hypothetical protein
MTRALYRGPIAGTILALTALAAAAPVLGVGPAGPAPDWQAPVLVRQRTGVQLQDALLRGQRSLVAFREQLNGKPTIRVRGSTNGGASYGQIQTIATSARQASLAACTRAPHEDWMELVATSSDRRDAAHPNRWAIELAWATFPSSSLVDVWEHAVVARGADARLPDVACAGDHVYVAWLEQRAGKPVLRVAAASKSSLMFDTFEKGLPVLGGDPDRPVIVGFADRGIVVRVTPQGQIVTNNVDPDDLGAAGGGPTVIGPGTAVNPARQPVAAASGPRVVIAWSRCGDILARVSTNKGVFWGPIRTLVDGPCSTTGGAVVPLDVDADGNLVGLLYRSPGAPNATTRLIRTSNGFMDYTDDAVSAAHQADLILYNGHAGLGALYDSGNVIRSRRCPAPPCAPF